MTMKHSLMLAAALAATFAAVGCAAPGEAAPEPAVTAPEPTVKARTRPPMEPGAVELIVVRHRPARELARLLSQVGLPHRRYAAPVRVIHDDRTNTLILHGADQERAALRELVAALDRE
jgi:hypothetical protein